MQVVDSINMTDRPSSEQVVNHFNHLSQNKPKASSFQTCSLQGDFSLRIARSFAFSEGPTARMAVVCNRVWAHLSGKQLVILYFPQMQVLWDQS